MWNGIDILSVTLSLRRKSYEFRHSPSAFMHDVPPVFHLGIMVCHDGPYLLGTLNFKPEQVGYAYNCTALAAMISPSLWDGGGPVLCDRAGIGRAAFIGRVLPFCGGEGTSFQGFYPLLIAHTLCYMPTLALTNSLSFHQMKDPGKEFPAFACWERSVGLPRTQCECPGSEGDHDAVAVLLGGAGFGADGLYCLTLPHTPAKPTGQR